MARPLLNARGMSTHASKFSMRVEQIDQFEFRVRFDKEHYPELRMDEPAPLGRDTAPNPARILAAAIADCLSASLVFCLKKARVPVSGLVTDIDVELVRNEQNRLRIGAVDVRLHPTVPRDAEGYLACLDAFEDFCVVTQSVRQGLDVRVSVEPRTINADAS